MFEKELTSIPINVAIDMVAEAKAALTVKPVLLSARQVAIKLGISEREVRSRANSGRIPPADVRIGTSVRWRDAVLDRWIRACCPHYARWADLGFPEDDLDKRATMPI